MTTTATSPRGDAATVVRQPEAAGLALVRLPIGAMFLWVFFENLGKGLYTPAGYAGLINSEIMLVGSRKARAALRNTAHGSSTYSSRLWQRITSNDPAGTSSRPARRRRVSAQSSP